MKKLICALLALCLLLGVCALAQEDVSISAANIVQKSCSIVQSGDYYLVYCFAQVHNPSDSILCLNGGTFELYNGDQMLSAQEVSQLWPYFLNPGEDGFFFDIVAFEPNEDGLVIPSVTDLDYFVSYMAVEPQFAGIALPCAASIERDAASNILYAICELGNPTQDAAYDPTVSFALYTENGSMIYADGTTLHGVGVPAGGTTFVRFAIDEAIASQWQSYGVSPAQVQAKAMFRSDTD